MVNRNWKKEVILRRHLENLSMKNAERIKIITSLIIFFLCILPCKSQSISDYLTTCTNLLNNQRSDMYDEIEHYLLYEANKDSIKGDCMLDVQYHTTLGYLYELKYSDDQKAVQELEYAMNRLHALRDDKESRNMYKQSIYGIAIGYCNLKQLDKAIDAFEEFIMLSNSDEIDQSLVRTYFILANIYSENGDTLLAENAHKQCQIGHIKMYIKDHPQQSALLDQFLSATKDKESLEHNSLTNGIEYVNSLVLMGNILMKACGDDIAEPFAILMKAYRLMHSNNLLHDKSPYIGLGLDMLLDISTKYLSGPNNSQLIQSLKQDKEEYEGKQPQQ